MGILIAALFLTGCGRQKITSYEPDTTHASLPETKLTFFGYKYEAINVTAIEDSLRDFMQENEHISITYEGIKGVDYYEVLDKRISTKNGNDIFMVDQASVLDLQKKGVLADLSDLSTIDDFSDLVRNQMNANDTLQYVPTSISAFGLYCNEDLLKKHKQKIPKNLQEFMDVCAYFKNKGITPIVANNDISLKTIILAKGLYPVYQQQDKDAAMEQFNTGERDLAKTLEPGFTLVEEMIQRGYVDADEALKTEKTKDDLILFAKGEQPFMLTGAWAAPRLRDQQPKFTFSIHPYPILEDGCAMVINIDTRISVNANSPHVKEAKQFVEYLTQKDVLWKFVNSQSSFSPLKDEQMAQDIAIQPMEPYLTNGRSVIGADDNLIYPIWNLTRESTQKLLKKEERASVLADLRKQLAQIRKENSHEDNN